MQRLKRILKKLRPTYVKKVLCIETAVLRQCKSMLILIYKKCFLQLAYYLKKAVAEHRHKVTTSNDITTLNLPQPSLPLLWPAERKRYMTNNIFASYSTIKRVLITAQILVSHILHQPHMVIKIIFSEILPYDFLKLTF